MELVASVAVLVVRFTCSPTLKVQDALCETSRVLSQQSRVIVMPGSTFGEQGEGYVRFSYATSYEKLEKP
jgi:aspartate/methionine/tyrosine aminotransferase